jgi:hypothetical protein
MWFIHGAGIKSFLPEMAFPVMSGIDESRITTVCLGESVTQSALAAGRQYKVNMVWHEAVGDAIRLRLVAALRNQVTIKCVIMLAEKHPLPAIAALGDMMGETG